MSREQKISAIPSRSNSVSIREVDLYINENPGPLEAVGTPNWHVACSMISYDRTLFSNRVSSRSYHTLL